MRGSDVVVIEAALNGGRERTEHPAIPYTPTEVADEARRCAAAGAAVVHVHARTADGGWSADPVWYAETIRRIRKASDVLISLISIRSAGVPVGVYLDLLNDLATEATARPDLLSVNLGHIVAWEPAKASGSLPRRTVHFPNDYADVVALLDVCRRHGIAPELGVMDLGFVSNAVALRDDGVLPEPAWFLLELDSPGYGGGAQVAPATVENYDHLSRVLRERFPDAAWAAHGAGVGTYEVVRRALADGAHVRVGFEDAVHLADGSLARGNAEAVEWAVGTARERGREPASAAAARAIVGSGRRWAGRSASDRGG